jgi:hypothetical protein
MPMTHTDPDTTTLAELADPHQLYELSVQCAEAEIDFVDATYQLRVGTAAAR